MVKANITWNCKQISKMVGNGSLKFDNAIQRGYVWDATRQSMLIDSMLRNYPIPPMYTIKTNETNENSKKSSKVYDCLDGKQRCTTIARFKGNEFTIKGLEKFTLEDGEEIDINGCHYEDLPEELQDLFDSYTLTVYFFTDIEEDEITEMMSRLNNGKAMTGYENVRIKANDLDSIKELASHKLFDRLSATQIRNYTNEDLVIKTYIMLNDVEPCLDNKAIRPIIETIKFLDEDKEQITEMFDIIDDICGVIDKKVAKKILNKTHFVSLVPYLSEVMDSKKLSEIVKFLEEFFNGTPSISEVYNANCHDGSNHTRQLAERVKAVKENGGV